MPLGSTFSHSHGLPAYSEAHNYTPRRAYRWSPGPLRMSWPRGRNLARLAAQLNPQQRSSSAGLWRTVTASAQRPGQNGAGPAPAAGTGGPQPPQEQQGGAPPKDLTARDVLQRQQWARRQQQQPPAQPAHPSQSPPQPLPPQPQALLPVAVQELFDRVEADPRLQAALRASMREPSRFLRTLVDNSIHRFALHGVDESAVFRAFMAASKMPGYQEGDLAPVLQQMRVLAEEHELRRRQRAGSLIEPPLSAAAPSTSGTTVQADRQQQPLPVVLPLSQHEQQQQQQQQRRQQQQQQQELTGGLADTGAAALGYPLPGAAAAAPSTAASASQNLPPAAPPPRDASGAASLAGNNEAAAAVATAAAGAAGGAAGGSKGSIRDLLNGRGILLPQYLPGTYRALCPLCKGGSQSERSLSVTIEGNSRSAVWNCFRATCSHQGRASMDRGGDYTNDAGFPVTSVRKRKEEPPVRPNSAALEPPSGEVLEFLLSRGLSRETLERSGVAQQHLFVPANQREETVVAFPYFRDGQVVNIKYRTLDKKFWQVKGAEKILYGLDDVVGAEEVLIVEGELDKLSLEEAGFKHVLSVPDGAPARVKEGDLPPQSEDVKYSYLWNCRAWLDQAPKIIIATDNDTPGDALAEELARRLGRERCWRVRWPFNKADHEYVGALAGLQVPAARGTAGAGAGAAEVWGGVGGGLGAAVLEGGAGAPGIAAGAAHGPEEEEGGQDDDAALEAALLQGHPAVGPASDNGNSGSGGSSCEEEAGSAVAGQGAVQIQEAWYRKDANEVLLKDGPAFLRAFVENAEPLPIRGLLRFHEYYEDIMKHYYLQLRDAQGVSTGWPSLDQFYQVVPGELTIVTGVPNSGKSEWIDALCCNLSDQHGWTFAMCSMEKKATDHARHLVEKWVGKPFFDLPYARGVPRMSQDELDAGLDWVDDRFHLIRYEDDNLPSIDWVLDIAKAAVYRYGIRGLVIDPYNELDHQRPPAMTETEYVSQMLGKIKRFAQTCGVHVWFVAHPRQLREWKGQPPNLYDISGSAHFINKADNGIVVHRNRDPDAPNTFEVQILVRKVRNKAAGTIGDCVLEYDRVNGRYIDPEGERHSAATSQRMQYGTMGQQPRAVQQAAARPTAAAAVSGGGVGAGPEGSGAMFVGPFGTLESYPPGFDGGFE